MFPTGAVEYEPGVAEWPAAATSSDAAAMPQYRPYQPEALAGARVWYSSAAAADHEGQQGAAAAQAAETGAAGPAGAAAAAAPQLVAAASAQPDLIDLAAADQLDSAHSGAAAAAAMAHDHRDAQDAAAPPPAAVGGREPPDLYVCPITQVPVHLALRGNKLAPSCCPNSLYHSAATALRPSSCGMYAVPCAQYCASAAP